MIGVKLFEALLFRIIIGKKAVASDLMSTFALKEQLFLTLSETAITGKCRGYDIQFSKLDGHQRLNANAIVACIFQMTRKK